MGTDKECSVTPVGELSHDTSTMKGSSMHYYDKANDGHRYLAGRQKCAVACVHDNDRVRGWGIGVFLLLEQGDSNKRDT